MKKIILFFVSIALLASCSNVKTFKTVDFKEKKFYFDYKESGNIGNVKIDLNANSHGKKSETGGLISEAIGVVGDIAKEIGTELSSAYMEKKLMTSYQQVDFKKILTGDSKNTLTKYCKIRESNDINDNYDFINTITLERNEILVSNDGVYLLITVNSNIFNRNTSQMVWQEKLARSVRLNLDNSSSKSNFFGFKHIYDLATISEEKLTKAMGNATKAIAIELSNILTQDIQNNN